MKELAIKINKKGNQIFLNPTPTYSFHYLHNKTLTGDTFRGFHKIDKLKSGSKDVFETYFLENSKRIIELLQCINTEEELNLLERDICQELKTFLKGNIHNQQLNSFNKIRKPLDIAIAHFIAMASEFDDCRATLTPLLFLPLDSQMFNSPFVFSDRDIVALKVKRSFSFKDIKERSHYEDIQRFLKEKAGKVGLDSRIYFDLIHGQRYSSNGTNLLLTNPPRRDKVRSSFYP